MREERLRGKQNWQVAKHLWKWINTLGFFFKFNIRHKRYKKIGWIIELKRDYRLQKNIDRVVGGLPGTSTDHEFSGKKVRPFNRESGQTTTTLSNLS